MRDLAFLFALLLALIGGVGVTALLVQEAWRALKRELIEEVTQALDRHLETWPLQLVRKPDEIIPVQVSSHAKGSSFSLLLLGTQWFKQRVFSDMPFKPGKSGYLALYIS